MAQMHNDSTKTAVHRGLADTTDILPISRPGSACKGLHRRQTPAHVCVERIVQPCKASQKSWVTRAGFDLSGGTMIGDSCLQPAL